MTESYLKKLRESLALEKNIQVLATESVITSISYGMLFVIWQPFVLSLGASMAALGILNAVTRLLGSFSSPAWGRLSDKIGRKVFLIISNSLRAVAFIFCLIADTWYVLIPYVIFMGLSASYMQYNPARASLVVESVQREKRATAYSFLMFSSQVTSAIIAPVGGFLAIILGYKPIFYACIATEICCIILTKLFIQETVKKRISLAIHARKTWISRIWKLFKPEPYLKGLYIAAVTDSFAWGVGASILYGMLVETYGFNTYQLGLMSMIMNLSWAATQIPIGKLADRYGRKLFLMSSEFIGIITLIGWLSSRSFGYFAILQIPYGIVISTWVPTMITLLADSTPEEIKGEAMGRLQVFTGILAFPAPYIGGLLYDIWGFKAPILLNLLGATLALILLLLLVHEKHRSQSY